MKKIQQNPTRHMVHDHIDMWNLFIRSRVIGIPKGFNGEEKCLLTLQISICFYA